MLTPSPVHKRYVTVNDGGQAIVGNVSHGGPGASQKSGTTSQSCQAPAVGGSSAAIDNICRIAWALGVPTFELLKD